MSDEQEGELLMSIDRRTVIQSSLGPRWPARSSAPRPSCSPKEAQLSSRGSHYREGSNGSSPATSRKGSRISSAMTAWRKVREIFPASFVPQATTSSTQVQTATLSSCAPQTCRRSSRHRVGAIFITKHCLRRLPIQSPCGTRRRPWRTLPRQHLLSGRRTGPRSTSASSGRTTAGYT